MTTNTLTPQAFLAGLKAMDRTKHPAKDMLLLYGKPGVGKTSLAAQFKAKGKHPLFVISGEDNGYVDLVRNNQLEEGLEPVVISSWDHLRETTRQILAAVKSGTELPFCSVVFENLGGFEVHARDHQVGKYQKRPGKGEDGSYDAALQRFNAFGGHTGAKDISPEWQKWFEDLNEICKAGIRVILIAHAANGKEDNAETGHSTIIPDIAPKLLDVVQRVVGNIGYISVVPRITSVGDTAKKTKVDEEPRDRVLKFFTSPQFLAKNRYGIDSPIPMGSSAEDAFNNLVSAMKGESK